MFFESDAVFSEDRKYRYWLSRRWNEEGQYLNWIMLNPSTADENMDDPTIRKCIAFAKQWGFGAVSITNLFAYCATDPKEMKTAIEPVGPDNNGHIIAAATIATDTIVAWGNHGDYMDRAKEIQDILSNYQHKLTVWCLGKNKSGQPKHPLYIPYSVKPQLAWGEGNQKFPRWDIPGNLSDEETKNTDTL